MTSEVLFLIYIQPFFLVYSPLSSDHNRNMEPFHRPPKSPYAAPLYSDSLPTLYIWQRCSLPCPYSFALFRRSYKWNDAGYVDTDTDVDIKLLTLFKIYILSFTASCLRFLHVVLCLRTLFLSIAESYSVVGFYHSFLFISPVGGCLSCVQFLAVMRKAAINICMQLFV